MIAIFLHAQCLKRIAKCSIMLKLHKYHRVFVLADYIGWRNSATSGPNKYCNKMLHRLVGALVLQWSSLE